MNSMTLTRNVEGIVTRMDEVNAARDRALNEGRQVVRLSANSIRAVHRGEHEADRLADEARQMLASLVAHLVPYPTIYWAGYVQDAMKEFAEAKMTRAFVAGDKALPSPDDLGIEDAPFLNALAEAASELRREVLDRLRANDLETAERLLRQMDEVYDVLVTVDFPEAVTGGLRRTTDQLRAVLERTRGDMTVTLTQRRLEVALEEAQERFGVLSSDDGS